MADDDAFPTQAPVDSGPNDKISVGYLMVFSSTEEGAFGDGPGTPAVLTSAFVRVREAGLPLERVMSMMFAI